MSVVPQTPSGPAIVDIEGHHLTEEDRDILRHPAVAGIILFARNIASFAQVRELCREMKTLRPDLLICVDQEGGRVQRLRDGFSRLPPMARLGHRYQSSPSEALADAQEIGWLMAAEVRSAGIDLSLAPVLDMDDNFCPAIGDRAFGAGADQVIQLAQAFIQGMNSTGMGAIGKHFPGHGKVNVDSHFDLPVDQRSLSELWDDDMLPFRALASSLAGIMPAHILFPQIDSQAVGFSSHWLQVLLRTRLGFQGLIFSDDLSMSAAASGGGYRERTRAALAAGCDLLLLCNNRSEALPVLDDLIHQQLSARAQQQKLALLLDGHSKGAQVDPSRRVRVREQIETMYLV
ncbi:beta-N-acetylhexosaminidase [Halioxenophilus sp. WMMB6]|uniref:beta-N-acetylhexosaminidase n=1 Tax=Halioxenophilus sp. WMMB6 TaxID=3073815 RepID=UPI00295EBBFE|nr:beta-N-acetylhexosaminidase [Halioxenophilus sp. WMMB6]